jgi:hypothetical protein
MTWVPPRWTATSDNAVDIAHVGISLLHQPNAAAMLTGAGQ